MTNKVDVLIIGGGSIGLNSAYFLQKMGREITLIDRGQIGVGSSAGNAGHIVPSHIIPLAAAGMVPQALLWMLDPKNSPFSMRFSLDPNYIWWLLRFATFCTQANTENNKRPLDNIGKLSYQNFAKIIAEENISCSYLQNGLLFLYTQEKDFNAGIREGHYLNENGIAVKIYQSDRIKEVEPLSNDQVIGGIHYTGDASLHPAVYLKEMKALIANRSAELREQEAVIKFVVNSCRVTRVITSQAEYEPETIVLSAGAWSPMIQKSLGIRIPIQPAKGYSLTLKAPSQLPSQALLLGEKRVAVTPLGDQIRFTGRLEISELDQQVNSEKIEEIKTSVYQYLKIEQTPTLETWAGLRPTTPDGLPIIAKPNNIENLIIAAGHAMLGLSLGPGTGQVVAELAQGIPTAFDLNPFRLERF
ncbi:MAG TPA: FAD-dependent oxidoreductase [Anaerolineales bacterium]|nr:FAD-dependent oxidoreductase [Anaerolineales bacterium]